MPADRSLEVEDLRFDNSTTGANATELRPDGHSAPPPIVGPQVLSLRDRRPGNLVCKRTMPHVELRDPPPHRTRAKLPRPAPRPLRPRTPHRREDSSDHQPRIQRRPGIRRTARRGTTAPPLCAGRCPVSDRPHQQHQTPHESPTGHVPRVGRTPPTAIRPSPSIAANGQPASAAPSPPRDTGTTVT